MTNRNRPTPSESNKSAATAVLATVNPHEPAADETIVAFAAWLDQQLEDLEDKYQKNWTHRSLKQSFGR